MAFKDRTTTHRLIDLYEENELLWNNTLKDYHKKDKRDMALQMIAAELDLTEDDVKRKINSIRTQYTKERQKEIPTNKSGSSAKEDVYVSKWMFYQRLRFLDSYILPRRTIPNTQSNDDSKMEDLQATTRGKKLIGRKRPAREVEDNNLQYTVNSLKEVKKTRPTTQGEDDDDVYGKHIANELRSFSDPLTKSFVKLKFQSIIYEAKCSESQNQAQSAQQNVKQYQPSPNNIVIPVAAPGSSTGVSGNRFKSVSDQKSPQQQELSRPSSPSAVDSNSP